MRSPLCQKCVDEGVVRVAEELDHIVPLADGGLDHESNLQGLCHEHHVQKTADEQVARRKRKMRNIV